MTAGTPGWFADFPATWQLLPAKAAFRERREANRPDDVHLTPSQTHGVLPQAEYMARTGNAVVQNIQGQDDMKHVDPDDFVIHLRSFQGGIERSTCEGKVSIAYTVLEPSDLVVADYFRWLLKSDGYIQELRTTTNQLRDGQSIKFRDFTKIPLPVPPLEEQRSIADYLNRETARIDTLIEEQQRLIEMLRERRQAAIDLAFENAEMNSRVIRACLDVVDCPHTTPEVDDDGEYEAVRTASVRSARFRPGHGLRVNEATWRDRNTGGAPRLGDVIFAREGGSAGEGSMVPFEEICLGQRMVLLRVDPGACIGEFLLWQLYSSRVQDHFKLSMSGSAAGNIRVGTLKITRIWLPSLKEQRVIAADLNEKITDIDSLMEETERFIELARERRVALITAAVTGQVDVREMV